MSDRIKFYLDEHVPRAIAERLRRRGVNVVTVQDASIARTSMVSFVARNLCDCLRGQFMVCHALPVID